MDLSFIDMSIKSCAGKISEADQARLDLFRKLWATANEAAAGLEQDYATPDPKIALEAVQSEAVSSKDLQAELDKPLAKAPSPLNGSVFSVAPAPVDGRVLADTMLKLVGVIKEDPSFEEAARDLEVVEWDTIFGANAKTENDSATAEAMALAGSNPSAFIVYLAQAFQRLGMPEQALALSVSLITLALRVQLEGPARKAVEAIGQEEMEKGHFMVCPVCGSEPMLARVGGENATKGRGKVLGCLQCGTSWDFDRVRCARCGDQNSGHLHYFNLEGDDAHRINTCDNCGSYIRTVFLDDALAPCSFDVEDVLMAKLDALAVDSSIAKGSQRIPQ